MEYASPFVQLLGVVSSLLVCALCLVASWILLREKNVGAWLMLIGSTLALIGTGVPQGFYVWKNFLANSNLHQEDTYYAIDTLMYYSLWDWLSTASWLLFAFGLILFSLVRKGQSRRIAELETILSISSSPPESRTPPSEIRDTQSKIHH